MSGAPRTRNAVTTSVATSTTSAVIHSGGQNSAGGLVIVNDAAQILYLRCGPGDASSTDYTTAVAANGTWESPFYYTGRVAGVLASGTGNARVTEFG